MMTLLHTVEYKHSKKHDALVKYQNFFRLESREICPMIQNAVMSVNIY